MYGCMIMAHKVLSIALSLLIILTGFIPPRLSYAQEDSYTIAVLDLISNGISDSEARSLSDFLRSQITRTATSQKFTEKSGFVYKVIERAQMDKILEEFDYQSTGCTDEECAVELGKMLNVEHIVIGSVGLVGQTYTINARIVDIETASTLSVADYMFTGKRDNLLKTGVPSIVNELLYGKKQKKSKKWYYIIGGIVLAGGAAAALMSGGSDSGGGNGTVVIDIILDE